MDVAIVTARGGSKRVPRKNVRPFAGRSMITWAIQAARDCGLFAHVVVSTEDADIAAVAKEAGADLPFMRPLALADDISGTCDVLRHALQTMDYGPVARCCCLYGTSYALNAQLLQRARDLLTNDDTELILTAKAYAHPIERSMLVDADGFAQYRYPEFVERRTQDLPQSWHDAGLFYYFKVDAFAANAYASFLPLKKRFVELEPLSFIDIDREEDFVMAEQLFLQQHNARSC